MERKMLFTKRWWEKCRWKQCDTRHAKITAILWRAVYTSCILVLKFALPLNETRASRHFAKNCTMAVRSRTVLERVFPIYSGILNTSKPFKFICQRNLSQAQATDAKKLRAMVNVFVLLCRCFSWWSSYFSSIIKLLVSKTDEYYRWEFKKKKIYN